MAGTITSDSGSWYNPAPPKVEVEHRGSYTTDPVKQPVTSYQVPSTAPPKDIRTHGGRVTHG